MSQSRKTLTLSKTLSPETLIKIKIKRSPEETRQRIIADKKNRMKRIQAALNWLYQRHPDCFNRFHPKPLKLKIEHDILKDYDEIIDRDSLPSKKSLRDALLYYTHSKKYLQAYETYNYRIDLNGEEQETFPITEKQRAYADQLLTHIAARHKTIKQ